MIQVAMSHHKVGDALFTDGLLQGDINGDGMADITIELLGVTSLTGDDIMGLG